MKTIIGFTVHQMSENDYHLFMFNDFRNSSINFIAYDLSYLIYGYALNDRYCDKILKSYEELITVLSEYNTIILYFDQTLHTRKIFELLSIHSEKLYIKIQSSKIPLFNTTFSKIQKISKLFNKNYRNDFIYRKMNKTKGLNILLFEAGTSQKGIEIPSFEYDTFLKLKRNKLESTQAFHLFLDQNLPFHRDAKLFNLKTIKNYDLYYKMLDKFFTQVEQTTGKPVKIALHPRADNINNHFGTRETIKGLTAELSYEADIIFAHYSTAIHYPIIMNKCLLLLTSTELKTTPLNTNIQAFASALELDPLDIDTFNDFAHLYELCNLNQYTKYKQKYIISDNLSPDLLGSEIIINQLTEYVRN